MGIGLSIRAIQVTIYDFNSPDTTNTEWMIYGTGLHGSAKTTAATRRVIQHSQERLKALAERRGLNEKTVAKWNEFASVRG